LKDEIKKYYIKKKEKKTTKTRVNQLLINPILIFQTRNLLSFKLELNQEAQPLINLMLKNEITKKNLKNTLAPFSIQLLPQKPKEKYTNAYAHLFLASRGKFDNLLCN
jgi:hypothetical protein